MGFFTEWQEGAFPVEYIWKDPQPPGEGQKYSCFWIESCGCNVDLAGLGDQPHGRASWGGPCGSSHLGGVGPAQADSTGGATSIDSELR